MDILGFILFCIVAAVCAWIADAIVPGRVPGGFLAAVIVGILGAWLGTSMMGKLGPELGGVSLLPAIVGSAALIFIMALIGGTLARGRV
ncbi:MAG TPA: GlsB/YeaQ/YmgE family stress response membrane protein [Candidatus Obscuribacterales bacterium]